MRPKIGELFASISRDEEDICNARLDKLLNLPLDQHLAADSQQPLRYPIRNGCETAAVARRHQYGIFYTIGRKAQLRICTLRCVPRLVQRALPHKFLVRHPLCSKECTRLW